MYLSRLVIKNYRSIKQLDLKFKKGKNVIVGRNNAGKSNIIKAIDLILGESSPAYEKNENITENDFHDGDTTEPIYIYCELARDSREPLNYEEMYKCFGLKVCAKITGWERQGGRNVPVKELVRFSLCTDAHLSDDTFFEKMDMLFSVEDKDYSYIDTKKPLDNTLENNLDDKHSFAFVFKAWKVDDSKIEKDIRFLYKEGIDDDWLLAFSAPIRNELLQSAIIPSFRDPQNQLRISNWSWYGKLLRRCIDADNPRLQGAFEELQQASQDVFSDLKEKINNSKIKVAFPNTEISFQFNPDTKQDVHKSALIYVDDGFNSQLQDKGSGIQSTVIIGLFDYYTREIAHCGSSLLAIEEPELYLHPHGRRIVSKRLDDFLDGGKNQVILTTHSSEFIDSAHEDLNVIVVKKDSIGDTSAMNAEFCSPEERRILIKTQNTEMFFADYVVLVEGLADKYILEAIAGGFGKNIWLLGESWLNDYNVSIIAVGGKGEFSKYLRKMIEVKIPTFIIADFDFFRRCLNHLMTDLRFDQSIINSVNEVKGRLGSLGNYKKITDIPENYHEDILGILKDLNEHNIFILKQELEDYYTETAKALVSGLDGKEEKAVHIAWELANSRSSINAFVDSEEYETVLATIGGKLLGVSDQDLLSRVFEGSENVSV